MRTALRSWPATTDSPQRIDSDPHWVPRLPRPGPWELGVAGSIPIDAGCAQGRGRREKTSLSTRSPLVRPALASSPTISTADATSSAPPGGCTGPLTLSPWHSNPCLGTGSRAARALAGRLDWPALGLGASSSRGWDAALRPARAPGLRGSEAALRAAALRGLERCGRVRGRFARTPALSLGRLARRSRSAESGPLTRTSLLKPQASSRSEIAPMF